LENWLENWLLKPSGERSVERIIKPLVRYLAGRMILVVTLLTGALLKAGRKTAG
jgi:hypothetical protein